MVSIKICIVAISIIAVLSFKLVQGQLQLFDGIDAVEGEFPYMVSLRLGFNEHDCGGSIIGSRWILTAGHCSDIETVKYGTIVVDQYKYDPNRTIAVKNFITHPDIQFIRVNSSYGYILNDIAVIELAEDIPYGPTAKPVKLAERNAEVPYNQTGLLSGWGFTTITGDLSPILQKINITTYERDYCINNSMELYQDDGTNICGGSDKEGRGVCYKDSGSPYVIDGVQYGVLAWMTIPCGSRVVGFSSVSYYRDWIYSVTGI
ncbi:hypothetical protein GWI33_022029 [Rhynchophorus ferrugineus]|uniref:Peptidase S1 domain-containing protein n=1 Tax=Rhynchophorus ferrugineus TaxID=354439 RepID=A0A834I0J1_RHYFE|nr:hypothetical protein GWI33_022029 [Rhynchophorus ferrugineus]